MAVDCSIYQVVAVDCGISRGCPLQIYTPDKLTDLMSESDYVVAALPHTHKTEKLVSAEAINSMKKTGVFINIGRGQTVDEEALVKGVFCTAVLSSKAAVNKHIHGQCIA